MIKIAHASRIEKCKRLLKKARKAKQKRKAAFNLLTLDEQVEKLEKRNAKDLDGKIRLLIWDYNLKQLPISRFSYMADLIKERMQSEITEQQKLEFEKILGEIE